MAYVVTLLTLSILSASNGRPVWKCSVRDANFASSKVAPSSQTSIMTAAEQLQMKVQEDPFAPSQPMGSNLSYKYAEV
ncbi:hypothetical protein PHLCEN_2v10857 [Hermanssonia centrifuga]|uniref:Uncharacterized protein n=1 Tax=Hermanssonia centrifuga TaxID=98765 RepID=A0A2R6NLL2_9APHY|nr:hypothetical protein PHLCEN_2v10857 [Hermanssonia centrifuga]